MSFPQAAEVGVKLSAYQRTLPVPSSKDVGIIIAGWEAFEEHLYYNNQTFATVGVQKGILGGTQVRAVPIRDWKFILPQPMELS